MKFLYVIKFYFFNNCYYYFLHFLLLNCVLIDSYLINSIQIFICPNYIFPTQSQSSKPSP